MNPERETERGEAREDRPADRGEDPPSLMRREEDRPDHRFRDWALI